MADNNSTESDATAGPEGHSEAAPVLGRETKEKSCKCKYEQKPYFSQRVKDFISLLTLIAVSLYTGITILLWCNSNQQLSAVIESNKTNRESLTSVQRAFIAPSITIEAQGTGDQIKWLVVPFIENTGNTPTRSLRANIIGTLGPDYQELGFQKSLDAEVGYNQGVEIGGVPPTQAFLGPHAKVSYMSLEHTQQQLKMISTGEWASVLAGTIHYYDVFDRTPEHITEYCYRLHAKQHPDGILEPVSGQCEWFNCADDECTDQRHRYQKAMTEAYARFGKPVPAQVFAPITFEPR
jgi:hypothetical protein